MSDRREENHRWYESFDAARMVLTVLVVEGDCETELELPAKYAVCETCEGRGSHVNPSIDSNGLSADDFAEDPDFAEDYMRGTYDVPCNECGGRNVSPVIDEERANPEEVARVNESIDAHYRLEAEMAYERRMGY